MFGIRRSQSSLGNVEFVFRWRGCGWLYEEEILSLTWALLAAGVRGVLASLWPLDDGDAVALMTAFYQQLRLHGDAGMALATVQREMLAASAGADDARTLPLYWGSFVFTGMSRAE